MVRTAEQEQALQELSLKAAVVLRNSIVTMVDTFAEHAGELTVLKPQAWMALGMLRMAVECGEQIVPLVRLVLRCHAELGSSADFGYDTPCGQTLKAVYDATNLCGDLARAAGTMSC